MKKIRIVACLSALLFSAAPLAACGTADLRETDEDPTVSEVTPQKPTVSAPAENEPAPPAVPEVPEQTPPAEEPREPENDPPAEEPKPQTPPVSAVKPQEPAKAEYIRIRTEGLNIRTGAGTSYSSLGKVESGTLLRFVKKSGGWYETRYKNRVAYVSADERYTAIVLFEIGSQKTEKVIEEGAKLLGTPYVYGATRYHDGNGNLLRGFTVNEFDCSSLMQYIYYRGANVLLNLTTRTQVSQGKAVSKANLKRGDLMFFTNASRKNNTGVERIGHVALYLGDNYILHTASDYAKIEQISAVRWSYFICARRVL